MQANGRADTYFEQIFPRYTEIAAAFARFLRAAEEPRPLAFLVDIPLCVTEKIPDFHRGYVERYRHFDLDSQVSTTAPERAQAGAGRGLVLVTRQDLDDAERAKRPECATCRHDARCEGVWKNYSKRYGWDEMVPAREPAGSAPLPAPV
jgi:cyclic pyranopterin phosphate synthase